MVNIFLSKYATGRKSMLNIFLQKVDWRLYSVVAILVALGIVLVCSSTSRLDNSFMYVSKQILALALGIIFLIILTGLNYEFYRIYYPYMYGISIILLVLVLAFGTTYRGTKAWLDIGYFSVQVSEITKLLFIVSLAGYLDRQWRELYRWQKLVIPLILLIGNVSLILLERDFSGTLVYFPIFLVMLYFSNVRLLHLAGITLYGFVTFTIPLLKTIFSSDIKYAVMLRLLENQLYILLIIIAIGLIFIWWLLNKLKIFIPLFYFICTFLIIVSGSISSYFIDNNFKDYQKKRLIVFISPNVDPLGASYNIIQSKIAIGSGRMFGKGIMNGKQTQLGYVPERHTDFIFSLLGEELGFSFSLLAIILYLTLIWRSMNISKVARDKYGSLVATGIAAMFAFYIIINIGMTIGLMPITGLPLPFLSYGGSSLFSSLAAISILQSIYVRRFLY